MTPSVQVHAAVAMPLAATLRAGADAVLDRDTSDKARWRAMGSAMGTEWEVGQVSLAVHRAAGGAA